MELSAAQTTLIALVLGSFAMGAGAALFVLLKRRRHEDNDAATIDALRAENRELRAALDARATNEAAARGKTRFLATVSHEIRTPLNGILGLAELLSLTKLEAEQASYVEAIGDCARSLGRLIEDILDFSKIEAGKLELRREEFALTALVESVAELLAPRAHAKSLEIASFVSAKAPARLVGDEARLRQVLINLVGNAVNFTEKGGVGLSVETISPGVLRFAVEDTGPGVPGAAQKLIFEEFEQGDGATTRREGGTGLGLAISRRLIERMGGALELASSSPAGSTFAFTLPILGAKEIDPAPRLEGETALIVAASRFEGSYLARYLREAGAAAKVAGKDEALALLARDGARSFSLVFVDCGLGEAAVHAVAQAAPAAGGTRLFLMFSPLERHAFGEAALPKFDGWLVKPIRAATLLERLAPAKPRVSPVAPAEQEARLSGLSALIAEDNDINALIATRSLAALGAEPIRAEDGARAVELAVAAIAGERRRFDVILMDLFMPRLDGLEAARKIRAAEKEAQARRTPILVLTASALEEDARAAAEAGADAVLTKPVELDALAEMILSLRTKAQLSAETSASNGFAFRHKTFVRE
ncbi:MAG TPA: ATP-binding protein [Methylocystis sp.]|nr:ATP-binding protein [Methylocystis sp.]